MIFNPKLFFLSGHTVHMFEVDTLFFILFQTVGIKLIILKKFSTVGIEPASFFGEETTVLSGKL